MLLSSPLCSSGNQGSERLNDLPKATQLVIGGPGVWTQNVWLLTTSKDVCHRSYKKSGGSAVGSETWQYCLGIFPIFPLCRLYCKDFLVASTTQGPKMNTSIPRCLPSIPHRHTQEEEGLSPAMWLLKRRTLSQKRPADFDSGPISQMTQSCDQCSLCKEFWEKETIGHLMSLWWKMGSI